MQRMVRVFAAVACAADSSAEAPSAREPYRWFLIMDSAGFITEAGLFFVLSRTLAFELWQRFYYTVLLLLAVDAVWGTLSSLLHPPLLWPWVIVNAVTWPILAFARCHWRGSDCGPFVCAVILLLRTAADYAFNFEFYFPQH